LLYEGGVILNPFKKLAGKKNIDFYQLLIKQCDKTLEGIKILQEYCLTHDEKIGMRVIAIEQEGDLLRRILIDEINNTFITPIEREDLYELSGIIDDILDISGSEEKLGKSINKDAEFHKSNFISLYGLEKSREIAEELISTAKLKLKDYGSRGYYLCELSNYIINREN